MCQRCPLHSIPELSLSHSLPLCPSRTLIVGFEYLFSAAGLYNRLHFDLRTTAFQYAFRIFYHGQFYIILSASMVDCTLKFSPFSVLTSNSTFVVLTNVFLAIIMRGFKAKVPTVRHSRRRRPSDMKTSGRNETGDHIADVNTWIQFDFFCDDDAPGHNFWFNKIHRKNFLEFYNSSWLILYCVVENKDFVLCSWE